MRRDMCAEMAGFLEQVVCCSDDYAQRESRDKGLLMVVKHHRVDAMYHCSCMTDQQCGCQHCKHLISSDVDMSCSLGKHQHHCKHNLSS